MNRKRVIFYLLLSGILIVLVSVSSSISIAQDALPPTEQLGKLIFFDQTLSLNANQSCADCHGPAVGWTGPQEIFNAHGAVYEGSVAGLFGNRKPPSSGYATLSPILHTIVEKKEILFVGGNFWDGRATGEKLDNPATEQAQGPFLNPLEQALFAPADVVIRVCSGAYGDLFRTVWGDAVCDPANVDAAYNSIALSISAYEGSPEVNAFTSKYDYYLKGVVDLTQQEKQGMNLFKSKGKCDNCHTMDMGPNGEPPLFTDFTFDNLGVPRNPENPFYDNVDYNQEGRNWVDTGLGGFLASLNERPEWQSLAPENRGKQKVPTLRNVGLGSCEAAPDDPTCVTKAYTHNGYFKSLRDVVHFYGTRDVKPQCPDPFTRAADALAQGCWPVAEITDNINDKELGKLNFTPDQEAAIVAFLLTLSDGYQP